MLKIFWFNEEVLQARSSSFRVLLAVLNFISVFVNMDRVELSLDSQKPDSLETRSYRYDHRERPLYV